MVKTFGTPVHDPKVLRAISHPTRNRILTELTASGPMRAVDLAQELGLPANQLSFHLRQLAKYGLIEEDVEAARDKRDRVWRPVGDDGLAINLRELARAPGGEAAAEVYLRSSAAWVHHLVDRAHSRDLPEEVVRSTSEHALRLTRDEARELNEKYLELMSRWTERQRGRDPERDLYLVHYMLLPYPELPTSADPADPADPSDPAIEEPEAGA